MNTELSGMLLNYAINYWYYIALVRWTNKYKAFAKWQWQTKTKVLREKPGPQIPQRLAWNRNRITELIKWWARRKQTKYIFSALDYDTLQSKRISSTFPIFKERQNVSETLVTTYHPTRRQNPKTYNMRLHGKRTNRIKELVNSPWRL